MLYNDLLPARYKNINFLVKKESITGGINKQYSSTPNLIKNRKTIGLVNLPTEITLDIVLRGALSSYTARKLLKLGESQSSGTLQIPSFGVFKNMVFRDPLSFSTDLKKVGEIATTISFVENLEVATTTNLLSKLDDLTQQLTELLDKWIDSVYFLSNLQEKVNTAKANINRSFTLLNAPLLLTKDLLNSLNLKTFFKDQQAKLSGFATGVLEVLMVQPKDKLQTSTTFNTIEQKQLEPINALITYNKITQYLAYTDNLKEVELTTQEELAEKINNLYFYFEDIGYENNLTTDIKEILDQYLATLVEFLHEKNELLPNLVEFEAIEDSSIIVAYRTLNSIDQVDLIEKINKFQDLDYITGKIKCLRS